MGFKCAGNWSSRWIIYSFFYWFFTFLWKKYYLQVYLDNCAYKIVYTEMIDYLDGNLSKSDENKFLINWSYKYCITIELTYAKKIDVTKTNKSKEYLLCHYLFFNHGFNFQNSLCNVCHDLMRMCLNLSNLAIITVKGVDYCCIIHNIGKFKAIPSQKILYLTVVGIFKIMHIKEINIKNWVYNYYVENLIKGKNIKT